MSWLPIAADFRDDPRVALDQAKLSDGFERLAAIAARRVGLFSSIALRRDWI
jgi:hypothetical protein